MTLSELSVRRPVLVTMIFVLIAVIACIFIPKLDIALYPSVSMPYLQVSVSCTGAGPEEIEMQVSKVLENQLGSVEGLKNITTNASSGSCRATLEFSYKTDLDEAANTVNNKLSSITRNLPDWAENPTMYRFDQSSNSSDILTLRITGPYSQDDLKTIAEDTAANLLLRIDGVGGVTVRGRDNSKYLVSVDPTRLASLNLTMNQVSSALSARNTQGTGGSVEMGDMTYQFTLDTRYRSLDEIRDTVITRINGIEIRVSDVANVHVDTSNTGSMSYINGEPVVTITVANDADSNASSVADSVLASLDSINTQLPSGVKLSLQRNQTSMISSTINEVYKSAIEGVILAAIIIFVFLRGIKTTFIIALSMPISILITLMTMSIAGITVNSISMSGLILGIGMIVDASICILENSYQYREKGFKPAVAAILGSKRMFNAIMASTLTTICVFIPIMIYKTELGSMGMMFQDLIYTICISLICSLFVAVLLVPALFGSILKVDSRVQKPIKFGPLRLLDKIMSKIEIGMQNTYAVMLRYCLRHRMLFILLLVCLMVFSLGFMKNIGMSLAPQSSTDDSVRLSLTMPNGTVSSVITDEVFRIEELVEKTLPKDSYSYISARTGSSGSLEIVLPDITEQKYSASEVKKMITPLLNGNARATWSFSSGRGYGGGSAVNVEIHSADSTLAMQACDEISAIIATYVPDAQNITTDIANGAPKYSLIVDQEIASALGVSVNSVLSTVQNALSGIKSTTLNTFSDTTSYRLTVELDEDAITNLNDIGSLLVSGNGGKVRLDSFVSFERGSAARSIRRENKSRVNHVTASAREGVSTNIIQAEVDKALEEHLILPDGVTIIQAGEMKDFENYAPTIIAIVIIALVLVYAVMAAQFESLSDPFIVFSTIPMLSIGVVAIHRIMGMDFSLFSIVGIVALIGVVVNNGIVLVDAINYEVSHKTKIMDACEIVAKQRLRPILMTTLTTVFGMVPMAFFPGEGAEMMQPIAITFVGGMVTGSLLTLFLSPVLYSVFNKRKEKHFDDPMSLGNQIHEYEKMLRDGEID